MLQYTYIRKSHVTIQTNIIYVLLYIDVRMQIRKKSPEENI
jgi:hypothetical protein